MLVVVGVACAVVVIFDCVWFFFVVVMATRVVRLLVVLLWCCGVRASDVRVLTTRNFDDEVAPTTQQWLLEL